MAAVDENAELVRRYEDLPGFAEQLKTLSNALIAAVDENAELVRRDGGLLELAEQLKIFSNALMAACNREQELTGVDAAQLFEGYLQEARKTWRESMPFAPANETA